MEMILVAYNTVNVVKVAQLCLPGQQTQQLTQPDDFVKNQRRPRLLAATELFACFDAQEACCHISQAAEGQYLFSSTSKSPIEKGYMLHSMAQS
ncbi:MAG: hypothetical protein FRX49_07280 [Trebouxia sp. A1-2]|nr:MAG: hypothetical protein FRX49_07280 [Trebouxia sp. A1-2]